MKRLLSLALSLVMVFSLTACTPKEAEATPEPTVSAQPTTAPTPTGEPFRFTRENFPRLDGSTANVPLGQAIAAVLLGESRESVSDLIQFNKTSRAYYNLVDGNADLLIVAEGGEDSYAYRDENGKKWRMEPIANETLVFFVNADNPVDGLTLQQVRDIYSGKITNWKEVGGADAPIQAYQRPKGGGSQAIMDKEVMGDIPMMEAPNIDYVVSSMEGIIEAVRGWDDRPEALGYTVYYYASDMGMTDGLKLLSIDGVAPNDDTIRSGEYPIHTAYYAVMDSETPADSPTGILFDWLLGQEGQDLIASEGYVSILEPSGNVQPEANAPHANIYTRWHGGFTDHLIPSPDYGPLIPFSGDGAEEEWGTADYAAKGLMTLEGKVVVDPVYAAVTQLCSGGDMEFGTPDIYYPAYLLSRYAGKPQWEDGMPGFAGYQDVLSRLCAADGSWVTEEYRFTYDNYVYGSGVQDGAIFALRDDRFLVLLDISTGKEIFSVDLDGLSENTIRDNILNYVHYGDQRIVLNTYLYGTNTPYLRCWDVSGNEISLPDDVDGLSGFDQGLSPARRTGGQGYAWGYVGLDGQWAIPPQFSDANFFEDGVALLGTHAHTLIDKEGNILYETPTYDTCSQTGDHWYFCGYSGDAGLVLDKQGNEINSPLLHGGAVSTLDYGWAVMTNADGSYTLGKGEKSWPLPESWGYAWFGNVTEDTIYLTHWTQGVPDDKPHWAIWRPESGEAPTVFDGNFDSLRTDPVTGEKYCVIYDDYSSGRCHFTDLEGNTIFDGLSGWPRLYAGRCLTQVSNGKGKTVELRDKDGSVLFRRTWAASFG